MSVGFYLDVHVPKPVVMALRTRGVDLLTAQEDNAATLPDSDLLDRAMQCKRVLVTFDEDFLIEAHHRQANQIPFAGVVFGKPTQLTIGQIVNDLHLIAFAADLPDFENKVEYLPL